MLETIALTFALLVAGTSTRAWALPLFKALNKRMDYWIAVQETGIARRIVQKAKQNTEVQARADLEAFQEAERNLNEARRALRSW